MKDPAETVASVAHCLGILEQFEAGLTRLLAERPARQLRDKLLQLPVRPSHALRSLGSYVSRAGQPSCIRLQFRQSSEQLRETLLHELAHACDHLTNQPGERYLRAHGPGWRAWATALGIDPRCTGHSPEIEQLRRQRLKLVAVCQRCGTEFHRLRRLPAKRKYVHPGCGGRLQPVDVP